MELEKLRLYGKIANRIKNYSTQNATTKKAILLNQLNVYHTIT